MVSVISELPAPLPEGGWKKSANWWPGRLPGVGELEGVPLPYECGSFFKKNVSPAEEDSGLWWWD